MILFYILFLLRLKTVHQEELRHGICGGSEGGVDCKYHVHHLSHLVWFYVCVSWYADADHVQMINITNYEKSPWSYHD